MISFKRLTRGIKLLVEHIYSPINEALDQLSKGHIPVAQYEKKNGTFRVSFYVPFTRHSGVGVERSTDFAFIMPPLQEQFAQSADLINHYTLKEISVGQDTRAEPGSVNGPKNLAAAPAYGTLDKANKPAYRLAIMEKKIDKNKNNPIDNELYSIDVPAVALTNPYERFNPLSQSDLSIQFRPDRTYMARIFTEAPGPNSLGTAWSGQMTSLFVTLKFSTELVSRDLHTASQNATTKISQTSHPLSTPVPAKNTPIEADSASGVNTAFKAVDQITDAGLVGGITRAGDIQGPRENLQQDAAYDVIAVPIFPGWGSVRGGAVTDHLACQEPQDMPWSASGAGNFVTMDRAIIPLQHPVSIHHVILGVNYKAPPIGSNPDIFNQFSTRPDNVLQANLTHEVGVGLITGLRADALATQQVANVSWTPATRNNYLIDDIDYRKIGVNTFGYSWDMMSCPLVGTGGAGYYAQGKPIYAIAGHDQASLFTRTNVNNTPPLTAGAEQALDIRWKISDAVSDPATWVNKATIVGYRGFWVYIICKKALR